MNRLRTLFPSVLILAWAAAAILLQVAGTRARLASPVSDLDRLGSLYARAAPMLEGVEEIGFVLGARPGDPTQPDAYYFQAQYALAPVRVYARGEYELSLAHFPTKRALLAHVRRNGLSVEAELHPGVALLRRESGP